MVKNIPAVNMGMFVFHRFQISFRVCVIKTVVVVIYNYKHAGVANMMRRVNEVSIRAAVSVAVFYLW